MDQSILDEAARRFPKGTIFRNNNLVPHTDNTPKISTGVITISKHSGCEYLVVGTTYGNDWTIWLAGEWAIVINSDYQPLIFN